MKRNFRSQALTIALATATFMTPLSALAAQMRIVVEGVITEVLNQSLNSTGSPLLAGFSSEELKGQAISLQYVIKPHFAPGDQAPESYFGNYYQYFGSDYGSGPSQGNTGKSYVELKHVIIGIGKNSTELTLPTLPEAKLTQRTEGLTIANANGFPFLSDRLTLDDISAILTRPIFGEDDILREFRQSSGFEFGMLDGIDGDSLSQEFDITGFGGWGSFGILDRAYNCIWKDGKHDCGENIKYDYGLLHFSVNHVVMNVIPLPNTGLLLGVGIFAAFFLRKKAKKTS